MAVEDLIIPAISVVVPIIVLFAIRGLDIGRKSTTTEVNLTVMMHEMPRIKDHFTDLYDKNSEINRQMAVLDERLKNHIESCK